MNIGKLFKKQHLRCLPVRQAGCRQSCVQRKHRHREAKGRGDLSQKNTYAQIATLIARNDRLFKVWLHYLSVILVLMMICSCAKTTSLKYPPVRWLSDDDSRPIQEPPKKEYYMAPDTLDKEIYNELELVTLATRNIGEYSKAWTISEWQEALNVNNFDEVADSTWFTNRIGRRDLDAGEIANGLAFKNPFNLKGRLTIVEMTTDSVIKRLLVMDDRGRSFYLTFDSKGSKDLNTASDLISSRILYAAGYNTLAGELAQIDLASLQIGKGALIYDRFMTTARNLKDGDFNKFIDSIETQDGKIARVFLTERTSGDYLNAFLFTGKLKGDSNDRIPHQHRRELRALRVFCSMLNFSGDFRKSAQDYFIGSGDGEGYISHVLSNFSPSLNNVGKMLDKSEDFFDVAGFDPVSWGPRFYNPAFDYMTDRDAFWAARILSKFSDDAIRSVVKAARYSDAAMSDMIASALIARRDKIVGHWFKKLSAFDNFKLAGESGTFVIKFDDLVASQNKNLSEVDFKEDWSKMPRCKAPANEQPERTGVVREDCEFAGNAADGRFSPVPVNKTILLRKYRYRLWKNNVSYRDLPWLESDKPNLVLPSDATGRMKDQSVHAVQIQAMGKDEKWWSPPVNVFVKKSGSNFDLIGISRKYH